ncbi:MAG TPA: hypothetical protein VGW34_11760 [Allosphingosinicella sp.]|nr:hypothetical protein [Allosphingosinicella sp.]
MGSRTVLSGEGGLAPSEGLSAGGEAAEDQEAMMKMLLAAAALGFGGASPAPDATRQEIAPGPAARSEAPCAATDPDGRCITANRRGVRGRGEPAVDQPEAAPDLGADVNGSIAAHSTATAVGGPFEPVTVIDNSLPRTGNWPAATTGGYPPCSGAETDDRCIQLDEAPNSR